MPTKTKEAVTPLNDVAKIAAFSGFKEADFAVFEVPGFAARMPLLKAQVKPRLTQIGEALPTRLSETLEEPVYPHVAQHLRRTVNAPEETWVAFSRTPRAYKPVVHLRVAVSAAKLRITVFVEDYADDKQLFADNLERNAEALSLYLAHHPTIQAYELQDSQGQNLRGHALDAGILRAFAQRMQRVKGQHAVFGIEFNKAHPVLQSGPELLDAIQQAAATLKPLYDCGRTDFTYTYTPETIPGLM